MSKELVSMDERLWIAKSAFIEMGKNLKFKVMDVDKVVVRLRNERDRKTLSPYVELLPISEDKYKNISRLPTFQKDPITGVYYGIPVDQDEFGNMKWQKIPLHDHMSLNLDRTADAKIWAALRFYPLIEGSPFQDSNPYYKVYDPVIEAMREEREVEMMMQAFNRVNILEEKPKEMVHFARYLGEEIVESANYTIIRGMLMRFARRNPAEFNKKWDNRMRSFGELFQSAIATGVVSNNPERGYLFRSIPLGFTEEEAVNYLSKDGNICSSLVDEVNTVDKLVHNVTNTMPKPEKKTGKEKSVPEKVTDELD